MYDNWRQPPDGVSYSQGAEDDTEIADAYTQRARQNDGQLAMGIRGWRTLRGVVLSYAASAQGV